MHYEEARLRRKLAELRDRTDFPAYDEVNDLLNALMATVITPTGERYRHEKRGTTYDVFGVGHANSSLEMLVSPTGEQHMFPTEQKVIFDRAEVVVYRDVQSGQVSIRPIREFLDGRFTLLPPRTGRPPIDATQTLATALNPSASTTAPPAAQPAPAEPKPAEIGHHRVRFKLYGHIMNGKTGTVLEWLGEGRVRVKFDNSEEPKVVNNLNLEAI